jgi:hypothetical protein
MPNSSKIAFIFHGEPKANSDSKPLEHLGNDVEKMETILDPLWSIKKEGFLERSFFSEESLSHYKANELDVLFYFTGHGIDHEDDTLDKYTLQLSDDETQNITTKELVAFLSEKLQPKTLTIILDTCYSGQASIETGNNNNIQLLSSSNYTQESYENWDVGGGLFTYFFCRAIESACGKDETGKITLGDIANHIREPLKKESQNIVEKSINLGELSSLPIAFNKEVWEIRKKIKQHYKTIEFSIEKQINRFKYDILRFYPRTKEELYNRIRTSKSMNDLLDVLFDDRKSSYLYCILDFLKIEDNYCHTFQGNKECIEVKTKIKGIIVVVEANTNNDAYKADIYRVLDNEKVEESGSIAETTWENLYKKELVVELEKVLALNCVAKLELQLVLPIKLMKNEFKKEDIQIYVIEGMSSKIKWKNKFNITTKFLSRLKGYGSEEDFFFSLWDDNLTRYTQRSEQTIDSNVYCPSDVDSISNFCDNQALFLLSENSLVNDDKFVELYSLGIPFVITSQEDKCDFTSHAKYKIWTKSKVKNIRSSSYVFINEISEELHFLCDDGYSNEFLKLYQKKGKDEPKTENFLGDEDYE